MTRVVYDPPANVAFNPQSSIGSIDDRAGEREKQKLLETGDGYDHEKTCY